MGKEISKHGKSIVAKLAMAGLAAVGVGTVVYLMQRSQGESSSGSLMEETPFSSLQAEELAVDHLSRSGLENWGCESTGDRILARPTAAVLVKFHITGCPQDINVHTHLIQLVVDEERHAVVQGRLVSFSTMSARLRDAFGGADYIFLEGSTQTE